MDEIGKSTFEPTGNGWPATCVGSNASGNNHAQQVYAFLAPFHEEAVRTASRLANNSADAEDIFQDAVVSAIEQFPKLRDTAKFKPWFFQILVSRFRDRYRKSIWRRALPFDSFAPEAEPRGDDGKNWESQRAEEARVQNALNSLNDNYREAVVLADLEELSVEEIATIQKVSFATAKSRIARGREQLRAHYQSLDAGTKNPRFTRGSKLAFIAVVLMLLLVAACLVVAKFLLHVDFTKSNHELKQEVTSQLQAAGANDLDVQVVNKPDIKTVSFFNGGNDIPDVQFDTKGLPDNDKFEVRFLAGPGFQLGPADVEAIQKGLRELTPEKLRRKKGQTDKEFGADVVAYAASCGFVVEVEFVTKMNLIITLVDRIPKDKTKEPSSK